MMGQGFSHTNVQSFQALRGRVDTIWITACTVASRKYATPTVRRLKDVDGPVEASDGFVFCQNIAKNAQANVVASLDYQDPPRCGNSKGNVDSFEGTHFCWKPDGSIAWARRFDLHTFE